MKPSNAEVVARAERVIPGGVNSPVRAFGSVGGSQVIVDRAEGAYLFDLEGRRYIDYVQSYGASILGHAHPEVVAAITAAAPRGTSYGATTLGEVELAEMVCDRIPGLERLRLVSSGTEATMSALRLARGATGRDRIVMFAGNYHGHSDMLLAAGGSGMANQGISGSAGVTAGAVADTVVAPYNVVPTLDETVAAVIVEPVAANMAVVAAADGFLEGLRTECDRVGAVLIFDEVITGFRVGFAGASERFGVTPDLWTFGKIIGGGLPIGAFGGRADLLEHLAPLGPVYQAGTLSGNPLATAAGRKALSLLTPERFDELEATAVALAEGLVAASAHSPVPVSVLRVGTLVGLVFAPAAPTNLDEVKAAVDNGYYRSFFHSMLSEGIWLAPGPYEAMFPSLAHTAADLEATFAAAERSFARISVDEN